MKLIKNLLKKTLGFFYSILETSYYSNEYEKYRKKYSIDESFIFNGNGTLLYGDGEIEFGNNSYVGRYSTIQSSKGNKVIIGKNCKIGPFFKIWTQSADADFDFNNFKEIPPKFGDVIIEDAVWIGANVYVSPGITIGENSVIGANSVVTKDVLPFSINGGSPSKLIRKKNI